MILSTYGIIFRQLPRSSARAGLSGVNVSTYAVYSANFRGLPPVQRGVRRRPRLMEYFRRSSAVFRLWDRCFMELQISWSPKLTATLPPDLRQLPLVAPTANGINAHTRRAK